jgi:hypothetical protein
MIGDGSPECRSALVGGGLAEVRLKDTVHSPFVGDVIDYLRVGRTAFSRYFRRILSEDFVIRPERRH